MTNLSTKTAQTALVTAVALSTVLIFCGALGSTGIIDPSDGFYAEAGREMLESGNFLTPYLNYEPYFDKPILIYWLTAASMKLFGVTTFASRFPSAISAVLLAVILFQFCLRHLSIRAALIVTMILLSCPLFIILGRVSLIDMPLTLLVMVAMLSFFEALETPSRRNLATGYGAVALGILLKGPIAAVLVGLPLIIYLFVLQSHWKAVFQSIVKLKPHFGLLLILLVAAPWYVIEGIATKGEFLRYFFLEQNLARAAGMLKLSHAQPLWFFLPILAGGILPWFSFLPIYATRTFARFRKRRGFQTHRSKLKLFALIWSGSIFVLFSAISSKLPTYILPMIPAVALTFGIQMEEELRAGKTTNLIWCGIATSVISVALLLVYNNMFAIDSAWVYLVISGVIVVFLIGLFWWRTSSKNVGLSTGLYQFGLFACFFYATLVPSLVQEFYNKHQSDYNYLLSKAQERSFNLAEVQYMHPSASFCMKRKVPVLVNYYDFAAFLALPPDHHAILLSEQYLPLMKDLPFCREIGHRGKQYLFLAEDKNKVMLQNFYNAK
ncbi:MAG: glycosyltransferase family 39 protein [Candidatus Melainabacteria bacterium]|nr:glycosyltransferase family 39 protein [Candidatus Melainabacteria bacterium]